MTSTTGRSLLPVGATASPSAPSDPTAIGDLRLIDEFVVNQSCNPLHCDVCSPTVPPRPFPDTGRVDVLLCTACVTRLDHLGLTEAESRERAELARREYWTVRVTPDSPISKLRPNPHYWVTDSAERINALRALVNTK
jgi:hypothetical protein